MTHEEMVRRHGQRIENYTRQNRRPHLTPRQERRLRRKWHRDELHVIAWM